MALCVNKQEYYKKKLDLVLYGSFCFLSPASTILALHTLVNVRSNFTAEPKKLEHFGSPENGLFMQW